MAFGCAMARLCGWSVDVMGTQSFTSWTGTRMAFWMRCVRQDAEAVAKAMEEDVVQGMEQVRRRR